jgi:hypothetical protein
MSSPNFFLSSLKYVLGKPTPSLTTGYKKYFCAPLPPSQLIWINDTQLSLKVAGVFQPAQHSADLQSRPV